MTVMMALVSLKFKIVFLRAVAVSESDEDGKTILDPTSPKRQKNSDPTLHTVPRSCATEAGLVPKPQVALNYGKRCKGENQPQ
jgi:hypothetical protein